MDPQTDLPDLVEDLEVNIDELTEILSPLLNTSLSTTASSLPLLDKSKLYVLAAYSIESLLYSTLQASGVNAKEHAIFKELARLKGYFGKIKNVEEKLMAPSVPKTKLDVGAAARFIKAGLAGNDKYDFERAERVAKEKARAQLKARLVNKKFDENGEVKAQSPTSKKRDAEEMDVDQPVQDVEEVIGGLEESGAEAIEVDQPASKKMRTLTVAAGTTDVDSVSSPAASQSQPEGKKKKEKRKKRGRKQDKSAEASEASPASPEAEAAAEPEETELAVSQEPDAESQPEPANLKRSKEPPHSTETLEAEAGPNTTSPSPPPAKKKRKQRGKTSKKNKSEEVSEAEAEVEESTTTATPARTTKTRSATSLSSPAVAPSSAANAEPEKPKRGRGRPPKAKK